MAGVLHRIAYDATIDDIVDVALRFANQTQAFQKQLRTNVIVAGGIAGLALTAFIVYQNGIATQPVLYGVVIGAIFGVFFGVIYKSFLIKEMRKQQRKVVAEQLGGKPATPCEIEIRPDVLWTRQLGIEIVFPWNLCTVVIDNTDDIEMKFPAGICIVRNRHFAATADRQKFLETARHLAGKSGDRPN
jgi:hypothetical protein